MSNLNESTEHLVRGKHIRDSNEIVKMKKVVRQKLRLYLACKQHLCLPLRPVQDRVVCAWSDLVPITFNGPNLKID